MKAKEAKETWESSPREYATKKGLFIVKPES